MIFQARDEDNITPLHEACSHGATEIVDMLLVRGAMVNAASLETHELPIHMAAKEGHVDIVKMLLKAADAQELDDEVWFCCFFALVGRYVVLSPAIR